MRTGLNTLSDTKNRIMTIDDDYEEIHRLYFQDGHSMKAIAERYGYRTSGPISRIFKIHGWIPRPVAKKQIIMNLDEIRKLYFEEGLTQSEIAKHFGFKSKTPIRRIFIEQGWESRHRWRNIDPHEVYELYFAKKFSLQKVADHLGLNSLYQVICVFEAHGWKPRSSNAPRRNIDSEEVHHIANFIAEEDTDIPYSLLVFHPQYFLKDLPITPKVQVEECLNAARNKLNRINLGNKHLI